MTAIDRNAVLAKLDEDWRDHMSNVGGAQPYTAEDAERRQHFFESLVSETSGSEAFTAPVIVYSSSSLPNAKIAHAGAGIIIDSTPAGEVTFSIDPQVGVAGAPGAVTASTISEKTM